MQHIARKVTPLVEQTLLCINAETETAEPVQLPEKPSAGLRTYQTDCIRMVEAALKKHNSTMYIAPTGAGKSVIAAELIRTLPGNVLVIAHRWELLDQLRRHITKRSGELTDLEQAGNTADGARVVVASIQTIQKLKRLHRFRPDHFGHIFIDECHHAVSTGYRRVLDYFSAARVIGCTATADRLDKVGMHNVFKSVAFTYDIQDAIRDKWLVRVLAHHVNVASVDLTDVGTAGGDLRQDQLDAIMSSRKSLHAIARATLDLSGSRPTLIFATSVSHAKAMVEVLNSESYRPGCADYVHADTSFEERTKIYNRHAGREIQFLVNVGILTEGWDGPYVSCIVLGRPTKSRALMTQMIGRGLRPDADKTDCLVLDFVGNTGRHKLATVADVLAGKLPPDVVARAKEKLTGGQADVMELLDQEERAEKERIKQEAIARVEAERVRVAQFRADVRYETTTADLFGHFKLDIQSILLDNNQTIKPGQVERLRKYGIPIPPDMTAAQASAVIKKEAGRRFYGHATYRQVATLARFGIDATSMRMRDAGKALDELAQNGWKRKDAA